MFNDAIPDAWAIVNRGDPICTLPASRDLLCAVLQGRSLLVLPMRCLQVCAQLRQAPGPTFSSLCLPPPPPQKLGFKRIGQRVNVDVEGNLIVRGGYFELSVVHRGTVVKNHMMGQVGAAGAAAREGSCGQSGT